MIEKFIPISGKLLAEPIDTFEEKFGNLIIPKERVRDNLKRFKILKKGIPLKSKCFVKGKEKEHEEIIEKVFKMYEKVEEGDVIIINPLSGTEITLNGKIYYILQLFDIVAKEK